MSGKPNVYTSKHWPRLHKCDKCPYTAAQPGLVKKHARSVHEKIRDHRCDECGTCFVAKSKLELHIKAIHKQIKDKFCDQCDYVTSYPDELRKHKNTIHSEDRGDGFECPKCGKVLTTKRYLRLHDLSVHQKVKDISCLLCLEMFSSTGMLFNRKFIHFLLISSLKFWSNKKYYFLLKFSPL